MFGLFGKKPGREAGLFFVGVLAGPGLRRLGIGGRVAGSFANFAVRIVKCDFRKLKAKTGAEGSELEYLGFP